MKKTNNSKSFKRPRDLNRSITEEDVQVTDKHMKMCLMSLQVKTPVRQWYTTTPW